MKAIQNISGCAFLYGAWCNNPIALLLGGVIFLIACTKEK